MSIVTVRAEVTWEGKKKQFAMQNDNFFKKMLKTLCEADDVEIISVESWDEDDDE